MPSHKTFVDIKQRRKIGKKMQYDPGYPMDKKNEQGPFRKKLLARDQYLDYTCGHNVQLIEKYLYLQSDKLLNAIFG